MRPQLIDLYLTDSLCISDAEFVQFVDTFIEGQKRLIVVKMGLVGLAFFERFLPLYQ